MASSRTATALDAFTAPAALLGVRAGLAAALLASPVAMLRAVGCDTATARRVSWLAQMLAVRDGAIAVGGLVAARRSTPAPWLLAGAVSDAVDSVAIAVAVRQGRLHGPVPVAVVAVAAGSAGAGGFAALRDRRGCRG